MARFRNLLVHRYGEVDNRRVLEIIKHNLKNIEEFEKEIEKFIKEVRPVRKPSETMKGIGKETKSKLGNVSAMELLEKMRTKRSFDPPPRRHRYLPLPSLRGPCHQHCGKLLDEAFRGDFTPLLSSIQLTELYTPFLRAKESRRILPKVARIGKLYNTRYINY